MTTLIEVQSCPPQFASCKWRVYTPDTSTTSSAGDTQDRVIEVEGFQSALASATALAEQFSATIRCGVSTNPFILEVVPDGSRILAWRVRAEFIGADVLGRVYDSDPRVKQYLVENGLFDVYLDADEDDEDEW